MTEQSVQTPKKGKNILVFADGTGNEGGLLPDETRSNVYKLYRATRVDPESSINPNDQIAFYVSGIRTPTPGHFSSWQKIKNIPRQMFGNGLNRKITECYVSIISVWEPGDRIYLFGFSRGAYTVRCLAHVLELIGIPQEESAGVDISLDHDRLLKVAEAAVDIFQRHGLTTADDTKRAQAIASFVREHACHIGNDATPYFIGVWDTVAATGWGRFFKNRYEVHLPKDVQFVRHAMSIDEYRADFTRVKWGGSGTVTNGAIDGIERFEQVWFAGNHADIGGSYPENESRLSDITLEWISEFVTKKLPPATQVKVSPEFLHLNPSIRGMMHDECMAGVGGTPFHWRRNMRTVDVEGDLHHTVEDRFALPKVRNYNSYAPYRPANLAKHPKVAHYYTQSPVQT